MAYKRGLGKGLSALLPENEERPVAPAKKIKASGGPVTEGSVPLIPIDKLLPNPNQPRKYFDEAELAELADSIRQQGILQPIVAEDTGDGSFSIIMGERRYRAARLAGLAEVPVIIRKYSDIKRLEASLVENIQRSNLNPIEEASTYKQLMDLAGYSQDEVAVKTGKNRATIANSIRLLKLPKEMQNSLEKAEISPGHARAILSIQGGGVQEALYREIVSKSLSVREAEKRAAVLGTQSKKTKKNAAKARAPELNAMEEKFIARLGTKAAINGDLNRGTIVIDYYSMEDLERLYEILGG